MDRLMSKRLYEAATTGDKKVFEEKSEMLNLHSWTHEENNCLHIASKFGHAEFARRVLNLCPTLLYQLNSREDTPLHVAARAGHLRVVKLITDSFKHFQLQTPETGTGSSTTAGDYSEAEEGGRSSSHPIWTFQNEENNINMALTDSIRPPPRYRSDSREIWRSQNYDGSTALHEALRGKHENVALHLLDLDSEVLVHVVNAKNESPLYLAAEAGLVRVLNKILMAGGHLNTVGPKDQTPFHAAVLPGNSETIKILYEWIPGLIEVQDSYGKTALHYATQEKSLKIMHLLLKLDPSSAYIRDKEGLTPLLVAVSIGPPESVQIILDACPGSIESLDNMGRNALHLAVMHSAVKCFSKISRMPEMKAIINEPDNEGNTPLHLATKGHKYLQARALLSTKHVDLTAKNNFGQTALDMSVLDWELSIRQTLIRKKLRSGKASVGRFRPLMILPKRAPNFLSTRTDSENLKQVANTLAVVAALLATITFAAAFTIPGGYKSDGPNVGSPTLFHKAALQVFLFSDTIALCCSMAALLLLIRATTSDKTFLRAIVSVSLTLVSIALYTAMISFISALYTVISIESTWVAILICITGCSFIFIHQWTKAKASSFTPLPPPGLLRQDTGYLDP